ncbi:nuclear cap-binding protein subunit 3-like [Asterias rubens]|uniref:nuclear cap-binding protein subunit 3-like n=1 Tax=Asterias rubens TaxID=7604 RepID=UPI0014551A1F|nr:nuclear cap-binding protein subunit 3-like [Asterias rubens]
MAEKVAKEEGETPTSSSKLEEVDANDDHLNLLESDSSESESEGRRKKAEPEKKAKKEYKDERINKSLSELAKETVRKYQNKSCGNFVTGFNVLSKESKEKRTNRAKRFGIKTPPKSSKSDNLHAVVLPTGSTIGGQRVRPEAIFISGVDKMSTQDVFNYFHEYDPSSIEWINDSSCNVVWLDPHSAARALYNMSQPQCLPAQIPQPPPPQPAPPLEREQQEPEPMEQEEEEDDDDILDLVSDRETGEHERHRRSTSRSPNPSSAPPSPPSSIGQSQGRVIDDNSTMDDDMDMGPVHLSREEASRTAVPCSSAQSDLVIRYATTDDKKVFDPHHRSQYYIKYGNPNFGGMKGLISGTMKKKIREGKIVPGQRKRRLGDEDGSDDEERQEYARKRRNHGHWNGESERHRRMEERDSDADSVEMDLQLVTKSAGPRKMMRMYADDEETQSQSRKEEPESRPQIADARERIKIGRPSLSSRLGYHAAAAAGSSSESSGSESDNGGEFASGSIPNLKIMVANDQDSWDDDDDVDDDEDGDEEEQQQRGVQDLRSRLESRRTNSKLRPSLSIQVEQDLF